MLDHEPPGSGSGTEPQNETTTDPTAAPAPRRRRAASRPTGAPTAEAAASGGDGPDQSPAAAAASEPAEKPKPVEKPKRARAARKTTVTRRKAAADAGPEADAGALPATAPEPTAAAAPAPQEEAPAPKARRARKRASSAAQTPAPVPVPVPEPEPEIAPEPETPADPEDEEAQEADEAAAQPSLAPAVAFEAPQSAPPMRPGALIFQAPIVPEPAPRRGAKSAAAAPVPAADEPEPEAVPAASADEDEPQGGARESRRRRRRSRDAHPAPTAAERGAGAAEEADEAADPDDSDGDQGGEADGSSRRRRRRRRRQTAEDLAVSGGETVDDPPNTVVKIREPRERRSNRSGEPDMMRTGDEVQGVRGSVRLAAKQQRRRDGRSTRSRRVPIITEAEFLARRESVERVMVVRQSASRTQIGVLEDGVLVEHYVNRESSVSYVGNVYLGKVQNVLSSMEAAFVDINKGRNAVLYAGEVNFAAAGLEGQPKRIEAALKSGQPVLVQVTKDPIQHKGARLTSQISLPGRYLVYIPGGSMMGISRKLPDTERLRLKQILKKVVPEDGGVIVRTAAEGASEEELARDVERLVAQWEEIERRSHTANAPALLHGEPDLTVRVIRDIFNEDFTKLIVSGDEAYKEIHEYLSGVAPELAGRVEHWTSDTDVFSVHRVDEQLAKGLDRKVWLPSGGSLVIDRTEAMVVIDVNTGKFTGQGSNSLEETVTRNNLEAAEEIVRQLRLRDLGGIIVIDFIDMVLESNRELVLRRLLECLGRDRTKHQVAEVTSLGLVQMTRKRVGQGLLEAFSETCDHCNGRGVVVHLDPVEPSGRRNAEREQNKDRGNGNGGNAGNGAAPAGPERGERAGAAEAFGRDEEHGHGAGTASSETRASRRRRRKGRNLDSDESFADGGSAAPDEDEPAVDEQTVDEHAQARTAADEPAAPDERDAADESAAAAEPAHSREPINLRAHAEDPDAATESDDLGTALADTGRPRKRRRAASRPAGPAGSAAAAS